jgi:hypothetical protein
MERGICMKKVFGLVIVICLLFTGCGEGQQIDRNTNNIDVTLITQTISLFMSEHDIDKIAKDIEFDDGNNLDVYFAITGIAKLDNYYNWAYDNSLEKDYFCLRVAPTEDSAKNTWYLYMSREKGKEIFEALKEKDMRIFAKCIIPEKRYEEGQNNMASVKLIQVVDW